MKKPTDEQLEELIEMFGDQLPDYNHYPRQFLYYWQIYLVEQRRKEDGKKDVVPSND